MQTSADQTSFTAAPGQPDAGLKWLCFATLGWAVLVLQAGGFTTSIQAGMAFLDWPLSNGSVNPAGWLTEIDKFAEHSHRLAATGLGLLCIAIAIGHNRREPRRGVRLAAYALVGLVILQGGLGGLRVLLDNLNIGGDGNLKAVSFAIAHAVNAQLTLALLAIIAASHTRAWRQANTDQPRERLAAKIAVGVVFCVIIFGAVMRQNRFTSWVSTPNLSDLFLPAGDGLPWLINLLHRTGALLAGLTVLIFAATGERRARRWVPLALLLGAQISLGVLSIRLPLNPHVRTIHLVVGAALFSTLCAQAALVHRARSAQA
jgi:cytochrome c oxidase assembly protein subunit 15